MSSIMRKPKLFVDTQEDKVKPIEVIKLSKVCLLRHFGPADESINIAYQTSASSSERYIYKRSSRETQFFSPKMSYSPGSPSYPLPLREIKQVMHIFSVIYTTLII